MRKLGWLDWLIFIFVSLSITFIFISTYGWVKNDGLELFSVTSSLIFPFLVGGGMLICWILTIIKEIKLANNAEDDNQESNKKINADIKIASIYAIGVFLYTIVIDKIGFLIGSVIFLILGMVYMNYDNIKIIQKIKSAAIVSIIAVPTLYFIFYKVFNVMLP